MDSAEKLKAKWVPEEQDEATDEVAKLAQPNYTRTNQSTEEEEEEDEEEEAHQFIEPRLR